MTKEQMRIRIAEACGWMWFRRPAIGPWDKKPMRCLYHPQVVPEYTNTLQLADMTERECNPVFIWREGMVPDYINDLNAMSDAMAYIQDRKNEYGQWLIAILTRDWPQEDVENVQKLVNAICRSTAAQQSEAFLKTIGKWEEA